MYQMLTTYLAKSSSVVAVSFVPSGVGQPSPFYRLRRGPVTSGFPWKSSLHCGKTSRFTLGKGSSVSILTRRLSSLIVLILSQLGQRAQRQGV